MSSKDYSNSSGLDKQQKSGTTLECRHKPNVELFSVDATNGFKMWRDSILNSSVLGDGRNIEANSYITAGTIL